MARGVENAWDLPVIAFYGRSRFYWTYIEMNLHLLWELWEPSALKANQGLFWAWKSHWKVVGEERGGV